MNQKKEKYISFFNDTVIFGIGIVFAKAIQFFLMPLYTTYLTETQYGRGELINSISDLLLPIVTLNLYEAGFRYMASGKYEYKEIYSTIITIFSKSVIVGFGIAVLLRYLLGWEYAAYLYADLYGYAALWLLNYLAKGRGDSKAFALSGILNAISLLFFSYIFIVVCGGGEKAYLLAISLAYIPPCIYLLMRNRTYLLISVRGNSVQCKNILLAYGMPLMIYNMGYWLVTVSGRYVLLLFKNEFYVGLYVAAMKISALMNMVFQAAIASFQLNAVKQYEDEEKEEYYSKSFVIIESAFFFMASLLILFSSLISKVLLKKGFIEAEIYTPIIVLSATLYAVSSLYGMLYSIYIKPKRNIPCIFISAAINIFIAVVFVNDMGIWAICLASVLCFAFQIVYRIVDTKSFCNIDINIFALVINLLILCSEAIMKILKFDNIVVGSLCILTFVISFVRLSKVFDIMSK